MAIEERTRYIMKDSEIYDLQFGEPLKTDRILQKLNRYEDTLAAAKKVCWKVSDVPIELARDVLMENNI